MSESQALGAIVTAMAATWIAIMWASSRIAGWSDLARVYRATRPFGGSRWRWQFIALRYYWGYGPVTVGASSQGLYLSLLAMGKLQGHDPLFIPWTEVTVRRPDRMQAFYQAELRCRRVPGVPIRINVPSWTGSAGKPHLPTSASSPVRSRRSTWLTSGISGSRSANRLLSALKMMTPDPVA